MRVLSLFDGMSCGRIALERAGFEVNSYYASEVDKYAIKVAQMNYPNTIQLGDINNWRNWDIDWSEIDLVMGGFPCQSWSFAGNRKGIDDPRGQLAVTTVDILNFLKEKNSKVLFLFENVKMKKSNEEYLSGLFGVEPIRINSNLLSAQNRSRLYWTNIENVQQPKDKGILLVDIVEDSIDDKYYINTSATPSYLVGNKPKGFKGLSEKSNCLTASCHKGYGNDSVTIIGAAQHGRYDKDGKIYQKIEYNRQQKSNSLTTVQKDSLIGGETFVRKLTPIECERLQTVPDNYTECVSNTQRYKMLGNGWTVDVIVHILKHIL